MGVVCSTPTDHQEYFPLLAVTISALKATPPSLSPAHQHCQIQRLLLHLQQLIPSLAGGVAKGRGLELAEAFVPLVEKRGDRGVALRHLLLWSLREISGCVLIPTGLNNRKYNMMWVRSLAQGYLYSNLGYCSTLYEW